MRNQRQITYGLFFLSLFLYGWLGYFTPRYETGKLFLLFGSLFGIYAYVINQLEPDELNFWFFSSIAFRSLLLFSLPSLSDDFYRFMWDGRLLSAGVHPFAEVPRYYMEHQQEIPGINQELFSKLNSPDYFSVYPPLAQVVFWISVKLGFGSDLASVVIIRAMILAAELGSLMIIRKLLVAWNMKENNVLLYALNPLVIIEFTGNLHFEAFMIFFLLMAMHFLAQGKFWKAGLGFAGAIGIKLVPFILLPALIRGAGFKNSLKMYLLIGAVSGIMAFLFFNLQIIQSFAESLQLYFNKFEFNASLYYLVREYGFYTKGYNTIAATGWKMGACAGILIMGYSFLMPYVRQEGEGITFPQEKIESLFEKFLFILVIYFLFSTTVHPWYVTTLLACSVFTRFRFAVIWTGLIFLTYFGYSEIDYHENLYLTAVEYCLLIGYLVWELKWKRS